ncbi:DM9 domain-containing protein [Schistosoma japonicum]|uniref:DM9 domain-containing protein n=1 Tax=Schistosoma japonicum TaxID=6182 RepID=A0A4Z2CW50_SCHJA|nr:DM9 domain-containing protein [Schistosoma japonicum]TNN08492.1 DM9 domain-containing protein [Schistosoma japonicum]
MARVGNGLQIPLSWVPAKNGEVPNNPIKADESVYVARCRIGDDLICGKFSATYGKAFCPHDSKELEFQEYELLCDSGIPGCREGYEWIMMNGGDVPENALVAGINKYGTPLYIVKARIQDEVCVGQLLQGESSGSFSWGGDEHKNEHYDVLVLKY